MKLLILPTISDEPSNVRYIIASDELTDPELLLQQTIAGVVRAHPNYNWDDLSTKLTLAGFIVPIAFVAAQPWDAAADAAWGTNFTVEFPADAQHEYAGKRGIATNSTAGMLRIVMHDDTVLTPWDQPYRLGAEGVDQIPLGPLVVPEGQFALDDKVGRLTAVRLLKDAGFECLV